MTTNVSLSDAVIEAALAAARSGSRATACRTDHGRRRTDGPVALAARRRLAGGARPAPDLVVALVGCCSPCSGLPAHRLASRGVTAAPTGGHAARQLADGLPRHQPSSSRRGVRHRPWELGVRDVPSAVADSTGAVWSRMGGTLGRSTPRVPSVPGRSPTMLPSRTSVSSFPHMGAGLAGAAARVRRQALRWFDGERFRDVVPAPPGGPGAVAEAPTGCSGRRGDRAVPMGRDILVRRPGWATGRRRGGARGRSEWSCLGRNCAYDWKVRARNSGSRGSTARAGRRSRTWLCRLDR